MRGNLDRAQPHRRPLDARRPGLAFRIVSAASAHQQPDRGSRLLAARPDRRPLRRAELIRQLGRLVSPWSSTVAGDLSDGPDATDGDSDEAFDAVVDTVDPAVVSALTVLAADHRVPGPLAAALTARGLPVPPELDEARSLAMASHLRHVGRLRDVAAALDRAGLRWAVVKGPVLATAWYRNVSARPYDDLDVLVEPSSLRTAAEVLGELGFEERNANWEGFTALGVGEVPLDDGSIVVDLHWSLVGLARNRCRVHLPTVELLRDVRRVPMGGVQVATLDGPATFVHLCVNAGLDGMRRLQQLLDLLVVGAQVERASLVEAAARARVSALAAGCVGRAEGLLGPVPGEPLAPAFGAATWRAVVRATDALALGLDPRRAALLPGAVVSAGGESLAATLATLARSLPTAVRAKTTGRDLTAKGGLLDWDHHAGGAGARDRYFSEVAQGVHGR